MLTLTLKVIVSITKTRSGKTPATSSTLEKYWIGSLTSLSSSNNLNFPTEKMRMMVEKRKTDENGKSIGKGREGEEKVMRVETR